MVKSNIEKRLSDFKKSVYSQDSFNKDDLEKLIMNDNANIKTLRGWRYEIFGKKAVDFKNGRIGITMDSGNVVLKEI